MRITRRLIVLIMLIVIPTVAQLKIVNGRVTYIAAGTVYTSLGREIGINDSSMVYVTSSTDTIAVLKVFAVSSKSSVCRVVSQRRNIAVGNIVVTRVPDTESGVPITQNVSGQPAALTDTTRTARDAPAPRTKLSSNSTLELTGRVSIQYYTSRYENANHTISQPGVVLDLHAGLTEIPLRFVVYSNFRMLSYGGSGPFSKSALNQWRIYRLSLEYDDGTNAVSIGRVIPSFTPSLGYIDGILLSRKFWHLTFGTMVGYQPSYSMRGVVSEYKKLGVFAQLHPFDSFSFSLTTAYSRTYFRSQLDREAASVQMNIFSGNGLVFYGHTEADIRRKSGDRLIISPSLTSLFVNLSYRLTSFFTLGIGADASRPFYDFSSVHLLPDSLLERRLRSGANVNATFFLPWGIMLYNTYTPRASDSNFARAYSDYASISFVDILSTGINLRSNLNFNENDYTTSRGYGLNVQKNIESVIDLNLRYQQYRYSLKKYNERNYSRSLGADFIISLSRSLALLMSYDRLEGYGTKSNSIFAEISVRL